MREFQRSMGRKISLSFYPHLSFYSDLDDSLKSICISLREYLSVDICRLIQRHAIIRP